MRLLLLMLLMLRGCRPRLLGLCWLACQRLRGHLQRCCRAVSLRARHSGRSGRDIMQSSMSISLTTASHGCSGPGGRKPQIACKLYCQLLTGHQVLIGR